MLPDGAHSLLHVQRIRELAHLLELVNANHDVTAFAFGNDLRKLKQFLRRVRFGCDTQRNGVFRIGVRRQGNLGRQFLDETFGQIFPFFDARFGLLQDGR